MPAANAQQSVGSAGTLTIEVTGSHLKRTEAETALPLQVFTREDLQRGGIQTVEDLLQRISANQSFGSFNEAKGEGSPIVGFTAASLRGLGSQRTLVLLNGRRLAPYALSGGQSVDLSGIPLAAIERVEILKDGASAIYGTDAIGGVINFILRNDFKGVETSANYFATEHGGGNNGRVNAAYGFGDLAADKYNFFVSADYFKQDSLRASQRDNTKTAYIPSLGVDRTSSNSVPANIRQTGGFAGSYNPTIPLSGPTSASCAPPLSFPTAPQFSTCRFDFAAVSDTLPETAKTNVIGRFTWQFDRDHQLFAEATYYHGTFTQRVSPTPVSSAFTNTPMTLPPTSSYYPSAFVASLPGGDPTLPLDVLYRTVELGPRVDQANVDQWRAVSGLQGTIAQWDYRLAGHYTTNREVDDLKSGSISEAAFGPLLRSGVINPFGPNTADVVNQMRATEIHARAFDAKASDYGVDLSVSKNVFSMPGGPLAVALGIEARRESLEQTNSPAVVSGDIIAFGGAIPSLPESTRTVWSMFGELNVPVVKSVEIDFALRYDHYSDFGGTTNPKVSLRWQPSTQILLRGSFGTGFRAPTLSDLFLPLSTSPGILTNGYDDPVRCPVTHSDYDCPNSNGGDGFPISTGGEPHLVPEKSQQANVGIVVEPLPSVSVSADYYWIEVKHPIVTLSDAYIFDNFAQLAPTHVMRGAPDAQFPDLPGPIENVIENPFNADKLRTSGIDIDLRWRPPVTPVGEFKLGLTGTYVIEYKQTLFAVQTNPEAAAGTRGPFDGAISRWRHYATADWTQGPWGATLAQTFQLGYSEPCIAGGLSDASGCSVRRVGSYSVFDFQGRYTGFKNLTLTFGIRNLLDTPPPVSNQQNTFQVGIDPSYADPRGRMYYGVVRYAFR